jgi:hypothetical protein
VEVAASRAWLIVATLGVVGCRFDTDLVDGYRCGAGETCPSGSVCVDGFCVSGAPDADPGDGGVVPDSAPPVQGCGGLGLLRDDFADTVRGPQWDYFEDTGATLSESGGHLSIALAANAGGPYAGYTSMYRYHGTDAALTVEVSAVAGHNTILEVRNYLGEKIQLVAGDGDLVAAVFDAPSAGQRNAIPYDAVAQRWWRIREADGTLYWEYSANGTAWNELASEADPIDLAHVRGILSAGDALATASEAHFEQVNPDEPSVGYCAASTVVDPFDDGELEPTWDYWEDGCTFTMTGGHIGMSYPTGNGVAWCGINSRELYDLTAGGVYLDAQGVANAMYFVNFLQVIDPDDVDTRAEIGRQADSISFVQRIAAVDVDTMYATYSATDHRYWKIAAQAGQLVFQTSPDAATWTTRMSVDPMFDLTRVQLIIGAGHYDPGPGTPVTTMYQGVNTP